MMLPIANAILLELKGTGDKKTDGTCLLCLGMRVVVATKHSGGIPSLHYRVYCRGRRLTSVPFHYEKYENNIYLVASMVVDR